MPGKEIRISPTVSVKEFYRRLRPTGIMVYHNDGKPVSPYSIADKEEIRESIRAFYQRLDETGICRVPPRPARSNADADDGDIVGFFAAGENKQAIPIKEGQSKEEAFKEKKAEWEAEKEAEEPAATSAEATAASGEPIELTGNELGPYKDIKELRENARKYYKEHLQGKTIEREGLGKVRFSRKGIDETITWSTHEDKLKAIPAIERVIKTGKVGKEEPLKHQRKDGIVAFIPITRDISIAGKKTEIEVLVGKDAFGHLYYDLFLDQVRKNKTPSVSLESQSRVAGRF